jgi:hypothetical protein
LIRVTRETHKAPVSVQGSATRAGGVKLYGEPNFRVVWGGSPLAWIGWRWTDRHANGNAIREKFELRLVPKYLSLDRWPIERWMPAESYGSSEQWHAQTTELRWNSDRGAGGRIRSAEMRGAISDREARRERHIDRGLDDGPSQRFTATVSASGTTAANPNIAINFTNTWPPRPIFICKIVGGAGAVANVAGENTATTGSMNLTYHGTPASSSTYMFNCHGECIRTICLR